MTSPDPFADLRIPSDYGRNPRRPRFNEAEVLEDVEPNLVGTMQRLAPETAAAWRGNDSLARGLLAPENDPAHDHRVARDKAGSQEGN